MYVVISRPIIVVCKAAPPPSGGAVSAQVPRSGRRVQLRRLRGRAVADFGDGEVRQGICRILAAVFADDVPLCVCRHLCPSAAARRCFPPVLASRRPLLRPDLYYMVSVGYGAIVVSSTASLAPFSHPLVYTRVVLLAAPLVSLFSSFSSTLKYSVFFCFFATTRDTVFYIEPTTDMRVVARVSYGSAVPRVW
uniref:Uncharacterized protein n=1 Tax=Plectus sambesii TaxID=2011161 RepID=A0A914UK81_9BILA